MHVQLTRSNAEKLLKWSSESNRSVGELANVLIDSIDKLEVSQEVKSEAIIDGTPAKRKVYRRQSTWRVTL
jgi:hypothetical protein